MTTAEYARWKGLQVRRPGDVPAAAPLSWQIEKHTEHTDALSHRIMPAEWSPETRRGDVGDALAVLALRESIRQNIEIGRGVRVWEAMELGATWAEVAAALDVEPDEARALLRTWVDRQHQLYLSDVAKGYELALGLEEDRAVEALLLCQLGDDERKTQDVETDTQHVGDDEVEERAAVTNPDEPRRKYEFSGCGGCGTPDTCAPAQRCWAGRPDAWISKEPGVSYRLIVNAKDVAEGTLQDVTRAVADLLTVRLGAAPERVAVDAQTVNMAFNTGAVQEQLDTRGDWYTVFDAYGEEPLRIRITKEE